MTQGDWILLGAGAVWLVGYFFSCALHPYVKCRWCSGSSRHFGWLWGKAFRNCHRCSGTGRSRRLGAYLMRRGDRRQKSTRIAPKARR